MSALYRICDVSDDKFIEESIAERIRGLAEMFPDSLRRACRSVFSGSKASVSWIYSSSRIITWLFCSSSAILVLPLAVEMQRAEFENQQKRQERNILLGPTS
ncbi:Mitochondrial import receptor subunit TOM22-like protein, partial [Fragariocoptes setiger]